MTGDGYPYLKVSTVQSITWKDGVYRKNVRSTNDLSDLEQEFIKENLTDALTSILILRSSFFL